MTEKNERPRTSSASSFTEVKNNLMRDKQKHDFEQKKTALIQEFEQKYIYDESKSVRKGVIQGNYNDCKYLGGAIGKKRNGKIV